MATNDDTKGYLSMTHASRRIVGALAALVTTSALMGSPSAHGASVQTTIPRVEASATIDLPSFLEQHFIGRDPIKESILGCTVGATTRLLQLRDGLAEHAHGDLDESVYVIAGDGTIRIGAETTDVKAGSLTIIPRGVPHALGRRSKSPLIVLSVLSGKPCRNS
jgi:mannose-6-phosphate isomerase-like protein (cupin superfamily)